MLIDTHCHINALIKETFDIPLNPNQIRLAQAIIDDAFKADVTIIINVATSLIESINSIQLAQSYKSVYATVGIHPNDVGTDWRNDVAHLHKLLQQKETNRIVGVGECGIDRHYPGYNFTQQADAFRAQIELALTHNVPLVVHTRDAAEETLTILHQFKDSLLRGTIHCFSEDISFAKEAFALGFVLGIGGIITYPKNNSLRNTLQEVGFDRIVLETDSPYLPPQTMRGKQNTPSQIKTIAHFIADLCTSSYEEVAAKTTNSAVHLFNLSEHLISMHL
jgi:TatD DNase family protein